MYRNFRLYSMWYIVVGAMVMTLILIGGCTKQNATINQPSVNIKSGDESAVCGMYITYQPGPRGEVYLVGLGNKPKLLKFGSISSMFTYMHQPDVQHLVGSVYVQNVGESGFNWRHPSNSANSFIDARKVWYVVNQDVCGSMGPTLAPFLHRSDAVEFSKKHGGEIVRFTQITSGLLKHLKSCTINFKFKKMGKTIAKPPEFK